MRACSLRLGTKCKFFDMLTPYEFPQKHKIYGEQEGTCAANPYCLSTTGFCFEKRVLAFGDIYQSSFGMGNAVLAK
jgi:hypothetical protein